MVVKTAQNGETVYACEICGFRYREKEWAKACEAWCGEHHSCNLEIIEHGSPPEESA